MEKILIIDDDESLRIILNRLVSDFNCTVLNAENGAEGIRLIEAEHPDLIISDLVMPEVGGMEVLKRAKELDEHVPVIIVTAFDEMSTTIQAIQHGAFDYVPKPIDHERFKFLVKRALEGKRLMDGHTPVSAEAAAVSQNEHILVGNTPAIKEIFKQIGMVSGNRVTVLVTGESGTGKELVSKIIHYSGITKDEPFIAVNCSALTETLLESELFGHVKGAFTGAIRDKKGKFELAGAGTILLDEISEMSPELQIKLLRVIQERQFERVGGEESLPVRARVIASSNRDLVKLVEQGKFREDLYFRLKVFSIELPPLRARKDDIPQLVVYLLAKINSELHKNVNIVPIEVMEMLQSYEWVGNVRELENILTQGVVLARGNVLEREYIILNRPGAVSVDSGTATDLTLAQVESDYIRKVLKKVNWNKSEAQKILGVAKSTVYRLIEEYGIEKED
jgi:two-component system response regulator AtoC